jgi:hypothetical protein
MQHHQQRNTQQQQQQQQQQIPSSRLGSPVPRIEAATSPAAAAAAAAGGVAAGCPEQPWLNTMLSRLGRLPEDALLEVIHRLVEVRDEHSL